MIRMPGEQQLRYWATKVLIEDTRTLIHDTYARQLTIAASRIICLRYPALGGSINVRSTNSRRITRTWTLQRGVAAQARDSWRRLRAPTPPGFVRGWGLLTGLTKGSRHFCSCL
jgi:hypothetical protein